MGTPKMATLLERIRTVMRYKTEFVTLLELFLGTYQRLMAMSGLDGLPDECKQLLWSYLDARELCHMACVARTVERGVRVDAVWQVRTVAMVIAELERLHRLRVPMEGGLQRQNASRQLDVTGRRSLIDSIGAHDREHDDEVLFVQTEHMSFWKDWYRDFYVTMRQFDTAQSAFEGAKSEVQDLKKQRADLRELLQAVKSKVHNEKNLRRMQMNCIRWLNRSHRRMNATKNSRVAQFSALSKAEVQEELQVVETTIQLQSKQLFTLRTKYQKSLHRVTSEVARGKRLLADLEG